MSSNLAVLPEELRPLDDLEVALESGRRVSLHRYGLDLTSCPPRTSVGLDRAYASKPLVAVEKQAMFPEIACLALFRRSGWDGVWVDPRHHKYFDKMPTQSKGTSLETYMNQLIVRIAENNGKSKTGCWDLILWENRTVVFVAVTEAFSREGAIDDTRARWLGAALRSGLSAGQFLVVQWDYRRVAARRKRGGHLPQDSGRG